MRRLGVGLIYLSEVDSLFREENPDLSVLELEPETFWEKLYPRAGDPPVYQPQRRGDGATCPRYRRRSLCTAWDYPGWRDRAIRRRGCHSAGLRRSRPGRRLGECAPELQRNFYASRARAGRVPAATATNVRKAWTSRSRTSASWREVSDVPFAFETGVNYLKPRADELSDGQSLPVASLKEPTAASFLISTICGPTS